jgi:hypothetical protein
MKPLLILFGVFCTLSFSASGQSLKEVRRLFHESAETEASCRQLLGMLKSATTGKRPLYDGYRGVATMMMANHVGNPLKKLSYFKEGRQTLEEAIRKDPANLELRFLRLSVQTEAPGFLNYNQHIRADRAFVDEALGQTQDKELKQMISNFLNRKK